MKHIKISDIRRHLIFKVMMGDKRALPLMYYLHNSYPDLCDQILEWLLMNNITGQYLIDWVKIEFHGSPQRLISYIIEKLNRPSTCPLMVGRKFQ